MPRPSAVYGAGLDSEHGDGYPTDRDTPGTDPGAAGADPGGDGGLQLKREYSPQYTAKLLRTYELIKADGYTASEHALNRILGRINQGRIGTMEDVLAALRDGVRYRDTVNGGMVLFQNGVAIHLSNDGVIKTVTGGSKIKPTWEELR